MGNGVEEMTRSIEAARGRVFALAIAAVALMLRLYVAFLSGRPNLETDSDSYLAMADAIRRGAPLSFFPNGFPLIIAAVETAVGESHRIAALLLLNAMLSAAVAWLAYEIGRLCFSARTGLAASTLLALWPNQINYARLVLSEIPAEFFVMLGVYLLLWGRAVASGLVLYFAAMIRSTLLPVGLADALLLAFPRARRRKAMLLCCGLATGLFVDLVLQYAGVIKAPANLSDNLLLSIGSASSNFTFSQAGFTDYEKAHPLATYLSFAGNHPRAYLNERLSALWELWGPWPAPGDSANPRSFASRLLIGLRFPAFVLALYAVLKDWRRQEIAIIAMPLLVVTAIHVAFFAEARFTVPVEPAAIILAAGSIADWRRRPRPM